MNKSVESHKRKEHRLHAKKLHEDAIKAKRIRKDKELDIALEDTFPASDATAKY